MNPSAILRIGVNSRPPSLLDDSRMGEVRVLTKHPTNHTLEFMMLNIRRAGFCRGQYRYIFNKNLLKVRYYDTFALPCLHSSNSSNDPDNMSSQWRDALGQMQMEQFQDPKKSDCFSVLDYMVTSELVLHFQII